jgi:phosphohistidine swiveling domain-containing protein
MRLRDNKLILRLITLLALGFFCAQEGGQVFALGLSPTKTLAPREDGVRALEGVLRNVDSHFIALSGRSFFDPQVKEVRHFFDQQRHQEELSFKKKAAARLAQTVDDDDDSETPFFDWESFEITPEFSSVPEFLKKPHWEKEALDFYNSYFPVGAGQPVVNPSHKPRAESAMGLSVVPDPDIADAFGVEDVSQIPKTGHFYILSQGEPNKKLVQLLKAKLEIHDRLVEANFAALGILNGAFPRSPASLQNALVMVDEMVLAYLDLVEGLDVELYQPLGIKKRWEVIRQDLSALSEAELQDPEIFNQKILNLKKISSIQEVKTLHEFVNYLHQISFLPVQEWAKIDNANLKISIENKILNITDISSIPLIQDNRVNSPIFSILLSAFEEDQSSEIVSDLVINDDRFVGHLKLGLHSAQIQAKLAPPDEGGMILVRYQEGGAKRGNQARIVYLKQVMEQLGFFVETSANKFLKIVLDKDHKARSLEDIKKALPRVIHALFYSRDLDLYFDESDDPFFLAGQTAEMFYRRGRLYLNPYQLVIPASQADGFLLDSKMREQLNYRLIQLGISPVLEEFLSQRDVEQWINEPIDESLGLGELLWNSDGRLVVNSKYRPLEDFLEKLSGPDADVFLQMGELVSSFEFLAKFKNVGSVGALLAQTAVIDSSRGGVFHLTVLRSPHTGAVIFARVVEKNADGTLGAEVSLKRLTEEMSSRGFDLPPLEPISKKELASARQKLYERWSTAIFNHSKQLLIENVIRGIAVSPGRSGKLVRGRVTIDKKAGKGKGWILFTTHTEPEDVPSLGDLDGIVTAGGSALSHFAIVAREFGIPAVILPSAELVETPDGRPAWQVTVHLPAQSKTDSHGFVISQKLEKKIYQITEGTEILIDGREGWMAVGEGETFVKISERLDVNSIPSQRQSKPTLFAPRRPEWLLSLDEVNKEDVLTAGGKAASLGKLIGLGEKIGFRTAPGFVVTTSGFEAFIKEAGIENSLTSILASEISAEKKSLKVRELFLSAKDSAPNFRKAVKDYLSKFSPGIFWAVRSSNVSEDSPEAAFAGAGHTELFVLSEQVVDRVIENFASLATARAIEYRLKKGLGSAPAAQAVVIQEMIDAEASGVIFTQDPVTQNPDYIVINASYGLGEAVVGGLVQADQYITDKNSADEIDPLIGSKQLRGSKRVRVIRRLGGFGTQIISTPLALRNRRALGRSQTRRLSEIARQLEAHDGYAVDIEFAIKNDEIYIIQTRPVTTGGVSGARLVIDTASGPSLRRESFISSLKDANQVFKEIDEKVKKIKDGQGQEAGVTWKDFTQLRGVLIFIARQQGKNLWFKNERGQRSDLFFVYSPLADSSIRELKELAEALKNAKNSDMKAVFIKALQMTQAIWNKIAHEQQTLDRKTCVYKNALVITSVGLMTAPDNPAFIKEHFWNLCHSDQYKEYDDFLKDHFDILIKANGDKGAWELRPKKNSPAQDKKIQLEIMNSALENYVNWSQQILKKQGDQSLSDSEKRRIEENVLMTKAALDFFGGQRSPFIDGFHLAYCVIQAEHLLANGEYLKAKGYIDEANKVEEKNWVNDHHYQEMKKQADEHLGILQKKIISALEEKGKKERESENSSRKDQNLKAWEDFVGQSRLFFEDLKGAENLNKESFEAIRSKYTKSKTIGQMVNSFADTLKKKDYKLDFLSDPNDDDFYNWRFRSLSFLSEHSSLVMDSGSTKDFMRIVELKANNYKKGKYRFQREEYVASLDQFENILKQSVKEWEEDLEPFFRRGARLADVRSKKEREILEELAAFSEGHWNKRLPFEVRFSDGRAKKVVLLIRKKAFARELKFLGFAGAQRISEQALAQAARRVKARRLGALEAGAKNSGLKLDQAQTDQAIANFKRLERLSGRFWKAQMADSKNAIPVVLIYRLSERLDRLPAQLKEDFEKRKILVKANDPNVYFQFIDHRGEVIHHLSDLPPSSVDLRKVFIGAPTLDNVRYAQKMESGFVPLELGGKAPIFEDFSIMTLAAGIARLDVAEDGGVERASERLTQLLLEMINPAFRYEVGPASFRLMRKAWEKDPQETLVGLRQVLVMPVKVFDSFEEAIQLLKKSTLSTQISA